MPTSAPDATAGHADDHAGGGEARSWPTLVQVETFHDARGSLGVVEGDALPFPAKRLYFLYDLPQGSSRGHHAHKVLRQVMICLAGCAEITFWDGRREETFLLSDRSVGVYVPAGLWRTITAREQGTMLAVLASEPYDEQDYIYSKQAFLDYLGSPAEGDQAS